MKIFDETKRLIFICLVGWAVCVGGLASPLQAQDLPSGLTELSLEELMQIDVIPVGVLGSHIHSKGEWMIGYRYMRMQMGETAHEHAEGHDDGFMVLPTSMQMEMHMAEVMYGVTNKLTVMAMLPYRRLSMDHQTRMGGRFTTASDGIGDVSLMVHYALKRNLKNYWVALLGVSLPTGSIDQRDVTPAGPDRVLPYPMQIGSGAPDLLTGITYIHQRPSWSWGVHVDSRWRLGQNDRQYRLGNEYHVGVWLSRRVTEWFAPTMRVDGHITEDVRGADSALNPNIVPTADPTRQGDTHLNFVPMLNFHIPRGLLKDHRFSLQGSFPVHQPYTGIPLDTDWQLLIAWQWTI